ncbi:DUF421 domain-containing protein [Halobacillus locisalis]|uniref:DUF421 domain-containing protein n=1 Tax=Halobacillus locisalis TaxID=220753 RepID=A0A838CMB2_9BACI|nr:DUF421 domain-containing protein [Halobacillus locisalis]
METYLFPIFRTIASFVILIIVTLMIGKHINSHKTHYSFALSITIGSIIANMAFDSAIPFKEMLVSFITIIFIFYCFLVLSAKRRHIRAWFSGSPTVLIENGKILEHNMRKIKFSLDDLDQHLRELGVFDLNELEFVFLEVSGQLSIKKKEKYEPVSRKDLQLPAEKEGIPRELIMDGKLIEKNLNETYSKQWVLQECKKRNLELKDVFYAVINSNGSLFIDQYEDHLRSPTDVE